MRFSLGQSLLRFFLHLPALAFAACGSAAPFAFSCLSSAEVDRAAVASALQTLNALPKVNALATAHQLAPLDYTQVSTEGRFAAQLIRGLALERAEDLKGALYLLLSERGAAHGFPSSASFRLRLIGEADQSSVAREKLFHPLTREPERYGWCVISNLWIWNTTRLTASQTLVELKNTRLSFRLFDYLRSISFFPPAYAYLFVLLTLAVGVKLLEVPLLLRAARSSIQIRELQPEIDLLRSVHRDDAAALQQRVMELYREKGINLSGGCLVFLADMVFVIWALVSLNDFAPQLVLDSARFWWVSDVTRFDAGLAAFWLGLNLVIGLIGQHRAMPVGQLIWSSLVTGSIFLAIAWHWNWPSYVFVFWGLLSLVGTLFSRVLMLPLSKFK